MHVARKRDVRLEAEHQTRTVDRVVADLEAGDVAAFAGKEIKGAKQIDGAGKAGRAAGLKAIAWLRGLASW